MDPDAVAREYVGFALDCERLLPGLVDCVVGPATRLGTGPARAGPTSPPGAGPARAGPASRPGIAARRTPSAMVAHARWLSSELTRSGMDARRRDFLDHQLAALRCGLRRAAGAAIGYRAEVRAYFDTEIAPGDPDRYRAAHAELDGLLPGRGPLAERLAAYRAAAAVPPELLGPAAQRLCAALREPARRWLGLPDDEAVYLDLVHGKPWSAFHRYLGGHRSRVELNAELPVGAVGLARLVAHEAYPGHHAEHVRAERALREGTGPPERAVFLVNTPQCLLAEGQADLGLEVLVGDGWGEWTARVLGELVPGLDGALAERVDRVLGELQPARQDAALMLHEQRRAEHEVAAYLRRWLLADEPAARQALRFLTHPRWRAYTTTYVEGHRLVRRWLAAARPGESMTGRYLELSDEPRSPSALRAALAPNPPAAMARK
jgi:hypothetical protein